MENKRIRNLSVLSSLGDADSLNYVQDKCILFDNRNVKRKKLINGNNLVKITNAMNKYYVDDWYLQYEDEVINAHDQRIQLVKVPRLANYAAK